jgi:hypothetical protein
MIIGKAALFAPLLLICAASAENACTLELHNGTRVDGNDIRKVSATSPESCCSHCSSTDHCEGFVFVNGTKPICWLKSSLSGAKRHDPQCTAGGRYSSFDERRRIDPGHE